jgi:hypothetical protein
MIIRRSEPKEEFSASSRAYCHGSGSNKMQCAVSDVLPESGLGKTEGDYAGATDATACGFSISENV